MNRDLHNQQLELLRSELENRLAEIEDLRQKRDSAMCEEVLEVCHDDELPCQKLYNPLIRRLTSRVLTLLLKLSSFESTHLSNNLHNKIYLKEICFIRNNESIIYEEPSETISFEIEIIHKGPSASTHNNITLDTFSINTVYLSSLLNFKLDKFTKYIYDRFFFSNSYNDNGIQHEFSNARTAGQQTERSNKNLKTKNLKIGSFVKHENGGNMHRIMGTIRCVYAERQDNFGDSHLGLSIP